MARLLVVSRTIALALRLADAHEVIEHPATGLDTIEPTPETEVAVLDVADPQLAAETLRRWRTAGHTVPVLVVSGYQPGWHAFSSAQFSAVRVIPLPITRAALMMGIEALTEAAAERESSASGPPAAPPTVALSLAAIQQAVREHAAKDPAASMPPAVAVGPEPPPSAEARDSPTTSPPPAAQAVAPVLPTPHPAQARVLSPRELDAEERPRTSDVNAALARRRAILGKRAPGSPLDGLRERLSGRRHESSLGPGGTSPELIALGLSGSPGGTNGPAPQLPASLFEPIRPTPPEGTATSPAQAADTPALDRKQAPVVAPRPTGTPPGGSLPVGPPRTNAPDGPAQNRSGPARVTARPQEPTTPFYGLEGFGQGPPQGQHPDAAAEQRAHIGDLVRELQGLAGDLFGVGDTAQVLSDDIVERAEADAAAVMVPDGALWRVSGGVGLRPLERRLVLDSAHWLISEIAVQGRALMVEDTDIVRPKLAGAPLASWRHLMAIPVPEVHAAVVLARGEQASPFTDRELAAIVGPVREAGPLLRSAMEIRDLARALGPYREIPQTPGS